MLKEFKEFAMKGNIIDMAIGVVIGGAFQKIVNSLVEDVIMPVISILTGKVDFSSMIWEVGDVSITYGNFITTIVDFLIIAFSIFLVVKYINKINKLKELGDLATKLETKIETKLDKKGKLKKRKGKKEEEKKEETVEEVVVEKKPETKLCPYCYTEIKFEATRCPHCTSVLEEKRQEEIAE